MANQGVVIDVRGITKSFGSNTVVDHLNMRVKNGEIQGFLGPNGSGKTTFIRMLCGLLKPDSGEGVCLGYDILRHSEHIKPHVGYMSQKFSLYDDLTVTENLDFMARMYSLPGRGQRVREIMDQMDLTPFAETLAGNLSGGWKQRLALAACLLHDPALLLLDEPTAGVDPSARRDFWDQLHHLAAKGKTVLISTHYMDEAERCHRLAYIAYGRLLAAGTPEELTEKSGLSTWRTTGENLQHLATELKGRPGVDQVATFGNILHVSGTDGKQLEKTLSSLSAGDHWEKIETSLEEVFISLMRRNRAR